jgi:hypothetical protein
MTTRGTAPGTAPRTVPDVAAIVLAGRAGAPLERALDSVGWAAERVVLDPAGRLDGVTLPVDVRRSRSVTEPGGETLASWLLLLEADEVAPPGMAAAVAEVLAAPSMVRAYRVRQEVRGFGAVLHPVGAPVRLAQRAGARLRLRPALEAELWLPGARVGRLPIALVASREESLTRAVDDLAADGAAMAVLLRAAHRRPRVGAAVRSALAAGGRLLLAPGTALHWGRWSLAVTAGYRAIVAYSLLWERARREAAAPG